MIDDEIKKWNPRYFLYCKLQGRTPEQQLEYDKVEHPGACMMRFLLWGSEHVSRYLKEKYPNTPSSQRRIFDHEDYDNWLVINAKPYKDT